jgi:hypothetical protein
MRRVCGKQLLIPGAINAIVQRQQRYGTASFWWVQEDMGWFGIRVADVEQFEVDVVGTKTLLSLVEYDDKSSDRKDQLTLQSHSSRVFQKHRCRHGKSSETQQ